MTRQEALDWKQHPVTQHLFKAIQVRIQEVEQDLGRSAGESSLNDRFKVGAITALTDILNLDFDFQEESY